MIGNLNSYKFFCFLLIVESLFYKSTDPVYKINETEFS